MRLQQIGPHDEGAAVAQLGVRYLQLGALAADHGPVLAPVELERLTGTERQRTKVPRPVVFSVSWRLASQVLAKAATRL